MLRVLAGTKSHLVLALGAFAVFVLPPTPVAQAQSQPGWFLVAVDPDQILECNIDGSNCFNVTGAAQSSGDPGGGIQDPSWARMPSIAQNGTIAFVAAYNPDGTCSGAGNQGCEGNVFLMNADGTNVRQLTFAPASDPCYTGDFDSAISPDGSMVAFVSDRNCASDPYGNLYSVYEAYVVNIDGSGLHQVTPFILDSSGIPVAPNQGTAGVYTVAWSPNSTQLAFKGTEYGSSDPNCGIGGGGPGAYLGVGTINVDGSNQTIIACDPIGAGGGPVAIDWSPDGTLIADARDSIHFGPPAIRITDLSGQGRFPTGLLTAQLGVQYSNSQDYVCPGGATYLGGQYNCFHFSPDSTQLAYINNAPANNPTFYGISIINLDGSGRTDPVNFGTKYWGYGLASYGIWWAPGPAILTPAQITLAPSSIELWPGFSPQLMPSLLDINNNLIMHTFQAYSDSYGYGGPACFFQVGPYGLAMYQEPNSSPASTYLTVSNAGLTSAEVPVTCWSSAPCTYSLTAMTENFGANGGSGLVGVMASPNPGVTGSTCPWVVTSNAPWITITSGPNGSGTNNVSFTVAANTGPARQGTMSIAGVTFTVSQNAVGTGLAPTTTTVSTTPSSSVAGQAYTVSVTVASQSSGTPTGTVSVSDDSGATCATPITLSGGAGSCSLTSTLAGTRTITATYSGDTNFAGSLGTTTETVLPGVVVKLSLNPLTATITTGQSQTYSAAGFDVYGNYYGDVTGSTTFSIAPNGSCTGSSCTVTVADVNGSTHTVTGTYSSGASGQASLTVNVGSFAQLQLLVPGETPAPGTVSGFTGTPNTEYVNGPFNVTVNAVDQYWNVVNTVTDTVAITSTDPLAALPANAALVAGTGTFSVTLETVSYPATTTLTATDTTNVSMTSTSPPIPVIVVYTASISPADAATGQATTYTLTVNNAAAPNTNNLGSLTVAIPPSGGATTNISITATQPSGSTATWGYDTTTSTPTMMNFRRCTATGSLLFDNGCTSDAANAIQPGGTIVIQFSATSNASVSSAAVPEVWTTTGYSDAAYTSALPLAGSEPTVNIGAAPAITSANSTAFAYNSAGTFTVTTTGVPTPTLTETGTLPGGVTFTDNGNGTATLAGTPSAAGPFPLTLTAHNGYGSDATQSFTLTVSSAVATVTLSNLTQTYTGSPLSPAASTLPSGLSIVWTGAPQTNAGSYAVTATVNAPNYQGSASGTFTINRAQPTVSFTGAPASAAYQSKFTVTATTNASTTATITASGACSIAGNTVTMTAATGTCLLTATWAGDNNYLAASATQSTTATKANPTVTFTGAPATAVYGSTFTIASTTNASTKPTYTGTSGICSVSGSTVTMKSGTGTCTLTASWAADSNYLAATATQTTAATLAGSTTAITASTPDPSVVGQLVAVSVKVSPVAPATTNPTGNVTVSDGAGDTCKATLSSGSGSCSIRVSAVGPQTLTATYNGSTDFSSSASAGVAQTVDQASTTTTITSQTPKTSVAGQAVTVKFTVAAVSPGKGTPTGSVMVSDGAGDACTATVAAGTCSITFPTVGSKNLTASYSGDTNFLASTSASVTQTVNQASTKTVITLLSPNSSVAGQPVTATFTVAPVSPASGTPTGNVTVSDTAGDTCTASVATGTCIITYAVFGNKSTTASYAGDANFASSKSAAVTQPVTDFTTSAPATKTVKARAQGTITITVAPKNSFTGTVALSCSSAAGVTCSLSPASVTPSGSTSATSTATVGSSTKGTYTLTFTGVYGSGTPASGGLTHTTTVTLTVD